MTREEAIELLKVVDKQLDITDQYGDGVDLEPYYDAIDMAIEALSKQDTGKLKNPCDSLLTDDSGGCKEHKSKLDLISRQTDALIIADALRYLMQDEERHLSDRTRADALREQILQYGANIGTQKPQYGVSARPKGEWIAEHDGNGWNDWENFICSVCGEKFEKVVNRRKYKFCSHCGADMRGEEDEID